MRSIGETHDDTTTMQRRHDDTTITTANTATTTTTTMSAAITTNLSTPKKTETTVTSHCQACQAPNSSICPSPPGRSDRSNLYLHCRHRYISHVQHTVASFGTQLVREKWGCYTCLSCTTATAKHDQSPSHHLVSWLLVDCHSATPHRQSHRHG